MKFHSHAHNVKETLPDLLASRNVSEARQIRKVVMIGCLVNAFLMLMKLGVGWYGHSEALVADGFHSMNDMAVDIIMLVFVGLSYRKANSRYAYGYGKFETFASLMIACLMVFIAVMIFLTGMESVIGYLNGETLERPDIWTFIAIIIAIACKEGLYRFYHGKGIKLDSTALRAAGWHHRLDAMSSLSTLVGVTCAHFLGEKYYVLDPIASLVIAITILFPAIRLLWPSFRELMDHSLPKADMKMALDIVTKVPGVISVDYVNGRRSGHSKIFDVKIGVARGTTVEQGDVIASDIEKRLTEAFCPHLYLTVQTHAQV